MTRLQGKTILITGGTTGIGHATARLFLAEGARVAVTGQDARRVAEAAESLGPGALAFRADVASAADMAGVAHQLGEAFGGLDALFANAGIALPSPLESVDGAHLEAQLDVNIKGVIHTVQKMLPLLRNPSSVILTGSALAEKGIANLSVYTATKAAVRSLARSWSAELVGRGIRVNVLSPGLVETPIYGKLGLPPEAVQAWASELLKSVPAGRMAQPDEIARAALFLASDDSTYLLGESLLVDGGLSGI